MKEACCRFCVASQGVGRLTLPRCCVRDLFDRTDLEPVMRAVQESVYGLQLNLDELSSPLIADESALQDEIERGRAAIAQLGDKAHPAA